jgi:hypothetical protein
MTSASFDCWPDALPSLELREQQMLILVPAGLSFIPTLAARTVPRLLFVALLVDRAPGSLIRRY